MLRLGQFAEEVVVQGTLEEWGVGLAIVAGSLAVGLAIDWVVVAILNSNAGPQHRVRASIARALRGQPEIWAVLIGYSMFAPFHFLTGDAKKWSDKMVIALAVLSVTLFLARLAGWLIRAYLSKDAASAKGGTIFVNLTRLVIWAVGITFMLGVLGVQIGPLVASLGVVGIAVSLGLQDTLANFFAGLQITMSRQIQPGQYIRLSTAEEGTVTDVTWRNTTMRAPSNDLVIIPNSVIARAQITNFTAENEQHTVAVPFTVKYGSNLEDVKRVAIGVATDVRDKMDDAVKEFEPTCGFRAFGPDGLSAVVTIRVERYQDRLPVVSELVELLHTRLAESGLELATGLSVAAPKPV
jgi:small-conductance mechanosensitive channel